MTDMNDTGAKLWTRFRFIVGLCLIVFFLIIHVWIKELPMWFVAMPAALLGINPLKWLGKDK